VTKPVDVVEELYELAGIPFGTESDLGLSIVKTVGFNQLFQWSLTVFCTTEGRVQKRVQKRFWKSVDKDSGARAAVFLATAVSSLIEKGGEDVSEKRDAIAKFDLVDQDRQFIDEVLGEVEADDACRVLSLRALEMAGGHEATRSLPPFERLADVEWRQLILAQNYEWTSPAMILPGMWSDAIQSFYEI
jgi:hypothetical protein